MIKILVALLIATPAFAEKTFPRVSGAVSVVNVPWGLVSVGGRSLRQLRAGKTKWETLYEVKRDNLYRVAAHVSGGLLAGWENDPDIHLFYPAKHQHVRLRKPQAPQLTYFRLDDLFFSRDGQSAIVFMRDLPGRPPMTTAGYRYDLRNPTAPPKELFRVVGLRLHESARTAIFAIPKDATKWCMDNGCWPIAEIRAYELGEAEAKPRTLLSGEGDRLERARVVFGSDDDHAAILVGEKGKKRGMLRWSYGRAAEYKSVAWRPDLAADVSWLTRTSDVLELSIVGKWGLEIQRHTPVGTVTTQTLPPLPRRLRMTDTGYVKMVKERANGDLVVHWSDYFLLVSSSTGATRLALLVTLLGEHEWAAADIYVPNPEAWWVGAERGGTRDYYFVPFREIERIAKVWPG